MARTEYPGVLLILALLIPTLAQAGAPHNEASWRARVDQPLRFLLPPRQ